MNRVCLPSHTNRGGLTLAEILISLLVMSIGVVSVATLFPLSVVRAVQGTNITNATHLAFNAEAVLRSFPELQYGGGKWNYGTTVTLGTPPTYIVPSETIKYGDFPGYILRATQGGTTGSLEPNWDSTTSGTVNDGSARWQQVRLGRGYVVDPMGALLAHANGDGLNYYNYFGYANVASGVPAMDASGPTGLADVRLRLPGPVSGSQASYQASLDLARRLTTALDSWVPVVETQDFSLTESGGVVTGVSLTGGQTADVRRDDFQTVRVSLIDSLGRIAESRVITDTTAVPLTANAQSSFPFGAKPINYATTPAANRPRFNRLKIELSEQRYSWILSARVRNGILDGGDIVVFFRRAMGYVNERVWMESYFDKWNPGEDALPGLGGVNDNGVGGTDESAELGRNPSDDVRCNFAILVFDPANVPDIDTRSYLLDHYNMQWYQIVNVKKFSSAELSGATMPTGWPSGCKLRWARETNGAQGQLWTPPADKTVVVVYLDDYIRENAVRGGAMIVRNVVRAFPVTFNRSAD